MIRWRDNLSCLTEPSQDAERDIYRKSYLWRQRATAAVTTSIAPATSIAFLRDVIVSWQVLALRFCAIVQNGRETCHQCRGCHRPTGCLLATTVRLNCKLTIEAARAVDRYRAAAPSLLLSSTQPSSELSPQQTRRPMDRVRSTSRVLHLKKGARHALGGIQFPRCSSPGDDTYCRLLASHNSRHEHAATHVWLVYCM